MDEESPVQMAAVNKAAVSSSTFQPTKILPVVQQSEEA